MASHRNGLNGSVPSNYSPEDDDEVDVISSYSHSEETDVDVEIRRGKTSFVKTVLQNVTIEPFMFLMMFAMSSTGIIVQDLYIDRICRIHFSIDEKICADFVNNASSVDETLKDKLDSVATKYNLTRGLIETIIPIIYALFLGSWTDIHGSKFPMLVSMFTYTLSALLYMTFSLLPSVPPQYLLLSSLPVSLGGGAVAIVLSAFSYITFITTVENRSFRIGLLEAFWFAGIPLGLYLGAKIYAVGGFVPVFIMSATAQFLAFSYCLLFVKNNAPNCEVPPHTSCCPYIDLFNINYVKDTFRTVFMKRQGPRRGLILLLIATVCMRIMVLFGPNNCMFLFVRHQFDWNEQDYSSYTLIESLLGILGGIIMITSLKVFKMRDTLTGLISCVGFIFTNLIIAAVPADRAYAWWMYLAAVFQMLGGMTSIIVRSMLSKIVPKHEIGKVFTFVACAETAVPIAAGFMYTYIFTSTENKFPGAFSLLSAGFNLIIVINFIYFFLSSRKHPEVYEEEDDQEGIVGIN